MIKFNHNNIREELQKQIDATTVRRVSANLDVYEPTLLTFMGGEADMRLQTVEKIAEGAGYDVEINFIKRDENKGENQN